MLLNLFFGFSGLCIVGELAGGWSVALAVDVSDRQYKTHGFFFFSVLVNV